MVSAEVEECIRATLARVVCGSHATGTTKKRITPWCRSLVSSLLIPRHPPQIVNVPDAPNIAFSPTAFPGWLRRC